MTNNKLFGTNGIRFIPGQQYGLDFIVNMGLSIGTFFDNSNIIVGFDGRHSSPSISRAISAGLMESGNNVVSANMVPTPGLQLITKNSYDGGVMITASHNPSEYNGIKVVSSNGIEVSRSEENIIEDIYFQKKYIRQNWANVGSISSDNSVIANYVNSVIQNVDSLSIKKRKLKIVIDSGNGTQALSAPLISESLGCEVITVNNHIDGNFSGRGGEPTPDTLKFLSQSVIENNADIGVGYDGDGDRSIFCDEKGIVFWGDKSGTLVAEHLIKNGVNSPIVTTIATSLIIEKVASKYDVDVHRTKVGSVDVSHKMLELNSKFGFEENGGCLYSPHVAVRDGAMGTALMLELLSFSKNTLSENLSTLPKFYQSKTKFSCPIDSRESIIHDIASSISEETDQTDGLKIHWSENSWSLIRPSGTEPIIRLFSESDSQSHLDLVMEKCSKLVTDLINDLNS